MTSQTQGRWVWVKSGRWWRTGKPGVLQPMGLQRVRHFQSELLNNNKHISIYIWALLLYGGAISPYTQQHWVFQWKKSKEMLQICVRLKNIVTGFFCISFTAKFSFFLFYLIFSSSCSAWKPCSPVWQLLAPCALKSKCRYSTTLNGVPQFHQAHVKCWATTGD